MERKENNKATWNIDKEKYGVEVIRIVNLAQVHYYIKLGLKPLDVLATDRLVFLFDKTKSKPYFDLWCRRKATN